MPPDTRPNVVLFVTDQARAKDAGYWGNPLIQTPNTDLIAREGAGFRWCFVQNPVSTPSRVAMASSWYCHVNGHRTMHHMLRRHEPNMLRYFKEAGYHVWWGGKNDMLTEDVIPDSCNERVSGAGGRGTARVQPWQPLDRLYHTFLWGEVPDNEGRLAADDHVAEQAAEFIRRPSREPFFMLVNQTLPHPPYAISEPWFSMYDRAQVPFPIRPPEGFAGKPRILPRVHRRMRMDRVTNDELREIVAVYWGMITRTDRNLGWIVEALRDSGRCDNTIIVATSDHGDFAGDYGLTEKMQNTFEDCLTNVPFAIRVPGCEPLPGPSEALIEMIDLLPTLAEACGVELAHTHFGRSLLPVLRGESDRHKPYVFCEGGALMDEVHTHESDRPWREIYWSRPALQFTEPWVHGKAVMIRNHTWKYVRRLYDTDELYHLPSDPGEVRNLIGDPALSEIVAELVDAMATWFIETGDQVPRRWDLRSPREAHPQWSAGVSHHGFVRDADPSLQEPRPGGEG
ncbi:MAG TPA: sulfatase-like hydrolase/transferase [Armatimonadota bacterium]|nr:sulfatase-like hydrolase/transferase [Armatimonadota bacterium]